MSFAEFSSLLAVFLSGVSAREAFLTLTQDLEPARLPAFIDEARRAGLAYGMRLREVHVPRRLAGVDRLLGLEVRDAGDDGAVRFVYAAEEEAG